eukprot:TRINITY_DN697_c0_g1_i14.p1 TRINITY_DN697_c0_g1~~TRINITY_DN697_c0_g1_i14.p1  ORF type:complete len:211 (-),score=17.88 TRINITY_DN697_c0_g1_i14:466-1098(-)
MGRNTQTSKFNKSKEAQLHTILADQGTIHQARQQAQPSNSPFSYQTMMTMNTKHDHHFAKVKHPHELPKSKGVSTEPHPLDRHSGMAFRSHDRKGGAGKFNIGSITEELRMDSYDIPENYNEQWKADMKMHKMMGHDHSMSLHTYMKMHNMHMEMPTSQPTSDEPHKREAGVPSHGMNFETDHPELLSESSIQIYCNLMLHYQIQTSTRT